MKLTDTLLQYWKKSAPEKKEEPNPLGTKEVPLLGKPAHEVVKELLRHLNCTYTVEQRDVTEFFQFDYQGGHFSLEASTQTQGIVIEFPHFYAVKADQIQLLRTHCNAMNLKIRFSKFVYTSKGDTYEEGVHIITPWNLAPDRDGSYKNFTAILESHFSLMRDFIHQFEDLQKQAESRRPVDLELEDVGNEHHLYLLNEQEIRHQPEKLNWRWHAGRHFSVEYLADFFYNSEVLWTEMQIVTDSVQFLNGLEEIRQYNLLDALLEGEGAEVRIKAKEALLVLHGKEESLTIQVMVKVETSSAVYFRINMMCPGIQPNAHRKPGLEVDAYTFVFVYDKVTEKNHADEFDFMWKDAKMKLKDNKVEELSDCQQLICDMEDANLARELYWSCKYFNQKRYYEALCHLKPVFQQLNKDFQHLDQELKEKFYRIAYLIGFCYNALQQYERAYFYLDIVFHLQRVVDTMEYVNCMVNAHDFRALYIINSLLETVFGEKEKESPEEKEDEEAEKPRQKNQDLQVFQDFLHRRKVYALIDQGLFTEAETLCKQLLEEPKQADFALSELTYLQQLQETMKAFPSQELP